MTTTPSAHRLLTLGVLAAACAWPVPGGAADNKPAAAATLAAAAPAPQKALPACVKEANEIAAHKSRSSFWAALAVAFSSDECGSVLATFKLLTNTTVDGGRKLKPSSALDKAEGAAQRSQALAVPAFKDELDRMLANETDPVRRKFAEATLLHAEGKFKARDLLLDELRTEAGIQP